MIGSQKISIITPVKGRTDLFKQTYDSVVAQNNGNWEWIIVDDGSLEGDFCEIAGVCQSDRRITYIRRDNNGQGASYCRNFGVKMSSCDWVVFLDADDLLDNCFVANRLKDINNISDVDFIVYRSLIFHEKPGDSDLLWNDFTKENDLDRFMKVDTPWQTSGVLWGKDFFNKIGGFDSRCKNWQDWEIHVRALALRPNYVKINRDIDLFYRKSELSDISTKNTNKDFLSDRIGMIDRIIPILKQNGQMTSQRKYYLAKLLFSTEVILQQAQPGINIGEQVIEKYRLVNNMELSMWKWYIKSLHNRKLSKIKNLFKKFVDKVVLLLRHDHFMETKTNFLNVKYQQ